MALLTVFVLITTFKLRTVMKYRYLFFVLKLIVVISSCSSGKKSYEKGTYYDATVKAINRLRQNPDHKRSRETLAESYPLAVETAELEIRNRLNSNAPFKYKFALENYQRINYLNEQIQRAPGARSVIPNPRDYSSRIPELKQQAAAESYAAGIAAMELHTREDAKNAYYHFMDVNTFVPGYEDVDTKIQEDQFVATLKVVVDQIPVPTRYTLSATFFQDKVEEHLHSQFGGNPFVRFYTPQEAETEQLPYVDQYLRIQFDDFVVGQTNTLKTVETFTKDSVVVGTVELEDGSKQNVYNTVSAKVTKWHKEVISTGLLSMQVYDAQSNAVLTHQKFNGEFVWYSEWGNFNGDERALTDEQISMCGNHEVPPPPPQELFLEFTRPIYAQLVPAIDAY